MKNEPSTVEADPADDLAGDDDDIPKNIPPVALGIAILYLLLLAVGVVWCVLGDHRLVTPMPWGRMVTQVAGAAGIGALVVAAVGVLMARTDLFSTIEAELATHLGELTAGGVVRVALLSSVAEEIFFRGAFQPSVARVLDSSTWGYVLTSLVFGLLHTGPARAFLSWTVFATACGFVLGGAFLVTGNIVVPIVIHFIINSVNMWRIIRRAAERP